ncbi:hypothetical protein LP420_33035 [Massilia sp. B-10]|nr:hypothetical protein LP420_33035 [Massilia sp. B-10]
MLARRPRAATLYDMQATPGTNAIVTRLERQGFVTRVHTSGNGAADLPPLLDSWQANAQRWRVQRERAPVRPMSNEALTSGHLARLWAFDQVRDKAADPAQRAAAVEMARTYQLVTPVSGAVVLESKAQYDAAGLEPVAPGSVPTIPEPETWAMLAVALIMLGVHRYPPDGAHDPRWPMPPSALLRRPPRAWPCGRYGHGSLRAALTPPTIRPACWRRRRQ